MPSHVVQTTRRSGATLIMMVMCIIALFGLLALALEVGMVAVARSQAQNPPTPPP